MDYKNRITTTIVAGASENIVLDTSTNGWLASIHLHFATAATGDVGLSLKRGGVWAGIATATLYAEGEAIWTGNAYTEPGDILKVSNLTATDATVWITITYELSGAGSWQTLDVGETEESSSSSSSTT